MPLKNKILVLFAHPALQKSRVNAVMLEAIKDIEGVTLHNLYEEYPDFHIDVKREQQLLVDHDIIIWHHPFYWYSAPAMIKEWIDLVLEHGFAYGRSGTALKGKRLMTAITTGGRKEAYQKDGFNQYTIKEFLAPFNRTVTLCNMEYLPPFVIFGSHLLDDYEIHNSAMEYREVLTALSENKFQDEVIREQEFMNDLILSAPKN
jgi:glutathione-regulated potassium-efflux system ancillary protein KefG